jgi:hypothetical protein
MQTDVLPLPNGRAWNPSSAALAAIRRHRACTSHPCTARHNTMHRLPPLHPSAHPPNRAPTCLHWPTHTCPPAHLLSSQGALLDVATTTHPSSIRASIRPFSATAGQACLTMRKQPARNWCVGVWVGGGVWVGVGVGGGGVEGWGGHEIA